MATMKEMAFGLLVLLVSINAMAEFAASDPALSQVSGLGVVHNLNSSSLQDALEGIETSNDNTIETGERTDLLGALSNLISSFGGQIDSFLGLVALMFRLAFGWSVLLNAIFVSIGVPSLSIVFVGPIMLIEIICIFYLFRDLVSVIRGVG